MDRLQKKAEKYLKGYQINNLVAFCYGRNRREGLIS